MPDDELRAAEALLAVGQQARAREHVVRHLAGQPDSVRGLCLLARCHYQAGEKESMFEVATRAIAAGPDDGWAWRLHSIAARQWVYPLASARSAREAVRCQPLQWQSHVTLAEALLAGERSRQQRREAYLAARRAVELEPQAPETHLTLGRVYSDVGASGRARTCFGQALALDPTHAMAMNNLAVLDLRAGLTGRAGQRLRDAITHDPGRQLYVDNIKLVANAVGFGLLRTASATVVVSLAAALAPVGPVVRVFAAALATAAGLAAGLYRLRRVPAPVRRMAFRLRRLIAVVLWMYVVALSCVLGAVVPAAIGVAAPFLIPSIIVLVTPLIRRRSRLVQHAARSVRGWWYVRGFRRDNAQVTG